MRKYQSCLSLHMCVLRWSADVSVKMYSRVNTHRPEWGADVLMSVFSSWLDVCVWPFACRGTGLRVCVCKERVPPRWAVPNEARSVSVGQTGLVFLRNQESWGGGETAKRATTAAAAAASPDQHTLLLPPTPTHYFSCFSTHFSLFFLSVSCRCLIWANFEL